MRGSLVFVEFLFLAATASFFSPDGRLRAQSVAAEQDLLLGSWQLDLVKSRYTPGPPPRSEVRTSPVPSSALDSLYILPTPFLRRFTGHDGWGALHSVCEFPAPIGH